MPKSKTTSSLVKLACVYILIILFGNFLYTYFFYPKFHFSSRVLSIFTLLFIPFVINAFIEVFTVLFSKIRKSEPKKKNPLWYRLIEGTFSIWVVLIIIFMLTYIRRKM
jgi:hypothetical protein